MSDKKEIYENSYIPFIVRTGRMTNLLGFFLSFGPVIVLATVYGIVPPFSSILAGFVAILSVSGIFWFVEPISYFPVLGIPGTYMSFLSGNISNLRLPAAAMAQESANVKPGTEEGGIIATIGVAVSIIVNVLLLTVGVIIGAAVLQRVPPEVRGALDFIIPAIFGALFAQFSMAQPKIGAVGLVIALIMSQIFNMGWLDFLPGFPSYAVIIVSVFGTVFAGRYMYEKGIIKSS